MEQELKELCTTFESNLDKYKSSSYDEANTRVDFIDKFFELLDWDVRNVEGYSEDYRDVVREDKVVIEGKPKAPDYSFRIGGVRKFFVEAKKPSINIKEDIGPAFQVRRYAYTAKLPLSILTDFEEFAVYDTRIKPNQADKASTARVFYCTYKEYEKELDFINNTFSKKAILKGSFDKYIIENKKKKGTSEVDKEFLKTIEEWRNDLARNLALRNLDLDVYNLNHAIQLIIDRIIFLRIAEDRNMEKYGLLSSILNNDDIYPELDSIFKRADNKYNSGLFAVKDWISDLKIDNKIITSIIKGLYYPGCPYELSVLPIEILGHIYEQFLGKTIRLTASHQAKVEEKPEVRKAGGVYYTPQYIVDYIVENTVGEKIKKKKPETIVDLKVLDPACGSGSFLVGAFTFLLTYHLQYYINEKNRKKALKNGNIFQVTDNTYQLSIHKKQQILLNNIYGVDIDHQAVEVTKLSLLLKLMEGEQIEATGQLFKHSDLKLLPDLSNNIKCGNSLIGSDFYEDKNLELFGKEEMREVNVFDWEKEFPNIFDKDGFDCIIGNPPWGSDLSQTDKDYLSKSYPTFLGNFDSYLFFIEKSLKLLKVTGTFSLITPDTWIKVPQSIKLREYILNKSEIFSITTLPIKVFDNVSANCIIFVINNQKENKSCIVNIMGPKSALSILNNKKFDDSYTVNTLYWKNSSDLQFQIFQKENVIKLIQKLKNDYNDAKIYLDVMQGIVPYSRENHSNETVEKRLFHSSKLLSDEYGIWIKGRAITRFSINLEKHEYLKYGNWLHRPRKKKYFQGDRILIQEITGGSPPRVSACYYNDVLYHDPGIISCLNISDFHLFFLLGIINSKLISWYHNINSPKGKRITFPKVLIGDIRTFPIPNTNINNQKDKHQHDKMVSLVEQIHSAQKELYSTTSESDKKIFQQKVDLLDRQIDQLVYELYGLTEEEIKIVEGL